MGRLIGSSGHTIAVTHPTPNHPLPFTVFVLPPIQRKSHRVLHTYATCARIAKMQFTTASAKFGVVAALLMTVAFATVEADASTESSAANMLSSIISPFDFWSGSAEVDIKKSNPSDSLASPALRRLHHIDANVGHSSEDCFCTSNKAKDGGLGFLEVLYTGDAAHIDTIKDTMRVYDARRNKDLAGDLIYDFKEETGSGSGEIRTDSADKHYFTFYYPTAGDKISETAFHFCVGDDMGPCDTSSKESDCGESVIFESSSGFCYYWHVHTSCSSYLIGEEFEFATPYFEIVRWGDRADRVCE